MRSRWLVLVVMCVGYFLVLLDVTIINVALPRIGGDLGAGVTGLQWIVDAYAIALASLMLSGGTIGDRYGHKRVVLTGLALFGAGSLGCALAQGAGTLIAARAAQGAGAAFLLPGTLAIITRAFPERGEQARAIGIWPASAASPCRPVRCSAVPWWPKVPGPGRDASREQAPLVRPRLALGLPDQRADRAGRRRGRCLDCPGK